MKHNEDIAIIGMAGRFAAARTIAELRDNLRHGRDSIREITAQRIAATTIPPGAQYRMAGYLDDVDRFDHALFNIPLAEAQAMDPIMRLLLEVVHETIENAGYAPDALAGTRTAVFVGDASTDYFKHADGFSETLITGNSPSFFATRIAKQFDLTGSAVMINTACSSSLVATHYAINELLLGEADQAIVCGANLYLFPFYSNKNEMDIWSYDGRSRAFSADASGMSNGEIIASIILKPLSRALADGDLVHAVLKGSAINNNANRARSPYSPDSVTQAEVIRLAWSKAGVDADDIGYIEAHGSGTQLGDSLEVEGLTRAFRASTTRTKFCPISTVKSNAGHGMSGAGLFGLIKTVLQLRHRELYPTLHFDVPNPIIDFESTAVFVNRDYRSWPAPAAGPRLAGVTSLGASGTNVHVVVAEAPTRPATPASDVQVLVPLSAHTRASLDAQRVVLRAALFAQRPALADVALTLGAGRKHHRYRLVYRARSLDELIERLAEPATPTAVVQPKIVWLLSDHARAVSPDPTDETTTSGDDADPRGALFLRQHRALARLSELGLDTRHLAPVGLGAWVARAMTGQLSVEAALAEARSSRWEPLTNRGARVRTLLEKQGGDGPVLFVDLAGGSETIDEIEHAAAGRSEVGTLRARDLQTLVGDLYLRGARIDWSRVSAPLGGARVELPGYQFERTRCWLREAPRTTGHGPGELLGHNEAYLDVAEPQQQVEEPCSEVEAAIGAVWCEVLGIARVSKTASFFDLGGDSIQATRAIQRINRALAADLDFELLYTARTIEALAACVRDQADASRVLRALWMEVLGASEIAAADNFFDLGGHSLLANQVIAKVRQRLGVALDFDEFFAHPTLRAQSALVELRRTRGGRAVHDTIARLPDGPHYALSSSQRRLWVLSQLDGASVAYNSTVAHQLTGPLSTDHLASAMLLLVERHESLRTVFISVEGEPRQKVLPTPPAVTPTLVDLRGHPDPDAAAAAHVTADERATFDLERGPNMRLSVLRLDEQRHVVVVTTHHLISDGWSAQVILRELAAHYLALSHGRPSASPPLPIQYRDYAAWELARMGSAAFEAHETYWLTRLRGPLPVLDLPTDGGRSARQTFAGRALSATFAPPLEAGIRALCRQEGVTLFMFTVAALKTLFLRYTEQRDIIIGTPVAGRAHAALEHQVGLYANTIALRTQLSAEDRFIDLLRRVKASTLEDFKHADYPLDRLVEKLAIPRDLSRSALFDVMVVGQATDGSATQLASEGLSWAPFPFEKAASQFDLVVELSDAPGRLGLEVEFNTSLYSDARIQRLLGHLETLVRSAVRSPTHTLAELEILSAAEQEQLDSFCRTEGSAPRDRSVHHVIAERARLESERVALVHARTGETMTYGALDVAAERLASTLREAGVGAESPVPLLLERGFDMVIAILAVWKAGGFYIPLDVRDPKARLRSTIEESGASVVLAGAATHVAEVTSTETRVVWVSAAHAPARDSGPAREPVEHDPRRLAYTIFTSGSTGRPKGAMVEHLGMMNHLHAKLHDLELGRGSVIAQNATHTFDISVWQFFAALIVAGRTVIFDREAVLEPAQLVSGLATHGVTVLEVVPSYLSVLLDQEDAARLPACALEYLLVTGEAVKAQLLARWFARCPQVPVVNAYGPTEASDDITHHLMRRAPSGLVPVGRPIQNTHIYVVDPRLQRVPVGVAGEICVAGIGVGRGYLNDPERTRQVFLDSPFESSAGQRMYRTGDRGRFDADGVVEFLGRFDHQVKVRGFRIELGEIEHQISRHPRVRETVVIDRVATGGDKELVAYVVAGPGFVVSDLKSDLVDRLPSHMIPAHFEVIDALPLTANGKVDRSALPDVAVTAVALTAPETPTEVALLDLYRAILGERVPISTDASFFDLGGHSLSATQLAARIHKTLGVHEPLADIFKHPSIRELGRRIDRARAEGTEAHRSIAPAAPAADHPLSPPQLRLYVLHQLAPRDTSYNMPQGLVLRGPLDVTRLQGALDRLIERHQSLRTRFVMRDEPRQLVADASRFDIEVLDPTAGADAAVRRFLRPFDLEVAPLLRVGLCSLGPEEHLLLVDVHHIIADGVSVEILVTEFMALYAERTLAPPPLQYVDYVEWLRGPDQARRLVAEGRFWKDELHDLPPPLSWPGGLVRPRRRSFAGDVVVSSLEPRLLRALTELARAHDATLYMVLLAAYGVLLGGACGRDDLLIGTDVAGRDHADLEPVVGMLVNTLVIRVEPRPAKPFTQLLAEVKARSLRAFAHARYPFEALVSELPITRDLSRNPLFDAFFALQNMKSADFALPGVTVSRHEAAYRSAKFDLSLECQEREGALECAFEFCTDVLARAQVEDFSRDYRALLERLAEQGELESSAARVEAVSIGSQSTTAPLTPSDPPTSRTELALLELWRELLGAHRTFAADDDFFDVGGHSLTAMQLVGRIHRTLDVKVPLREVFEHPTIRGLAAYVDSARIDRHQAVPVAPQADNYALSPGQLRLFFLAQVAPTSTSYNISERLELAGPLDVRRLEDAVRRLVRRHESLRTRFALIDDEPRQLIAEQVPIQIERRSSDEGFVRPFDLAEAPLLRVALVEHGIDRHTLLIDIHHIVADGVSMEILVRDLAAAYAGHELPAARPYKDYSEWLNRGASPEDDDAHRRFWRGELSPLPPALRWPGAQPRPSVRSFAGSIETFTIDADLTAALQRLAGEHDATLFMVLLAAYSIFLGRLSGQEELIVGTAVAGREHVDPEDVVGMFVNTVPIRTAPARHQTLSAHLAEVKRRCLGAFVHQSYAYDRVAHELGAVHDLSRNAVFDAFFVLHNMRPARLELPDLTITAGEFQTGSAKFDLSLECVERGGALACMFEYSTALFDAPTVRRMIAELTGIIEAVATRGDLSIDELTGRSRLEGMTS